MSAVAPLGHALEGSYYLLSPFPALNLMQFTCRVLFRSLSYPGVFPVIHESQEVVPFRYRPYRLVHLDSEAQAFHLLVYDVPYPPQIAFLWSQYPEIITVPVIIPYPFRFLKPVVEPRKENITEKL